MKNFIKYAQYYDLLYKNKNYREEVNYLCRLIKQYSGRRDKILLDIGCGTGSHDIWFAKKGYEVTGIDRSREMIAIAKNRTSPEDKIEFHIRDTSKFSLRKRFDIAVSLFHVMNYMVTNEALINSLKNIYKHLKEDSLFIFDFWYGPAVLAQRPAIKEKIVANEEAIIKRLVTPKIDINMDTVDVRYKISINDKKGGPKKEIIEHHLMRYFFMPELYLVLKITGFKVIKCLRWMSLKEGLSENSWSGVMVAKK